MFTGIIEKVGQVIEKSSDHSITTLRIQSILSKKLKTGESVAINGVCLTVIHLSKTSFKVELSKETIKQTTFSTIHKKTYVNLERALSFSSRLSGHLVTGHVDGVGMIKTIHAFQKTKEIVIQIPKKLTKYVIYKGSITIDGISLTINKIKKKHIWLMLIPHTIKNTTLQYKKEGDRVNIEVDIIGKYLERLMG